MPDSLQTHGLSDQIRSDQSLSRVWLFATSWIAARQASLSITNSRSSLRLTSIESVMPSSHLILCRPLLLLPPIPPSIKVFSNESTPTRNPWDFPGKSTGAGCHFLLKGPSRPRDQTHISCIADRFFTAEPQGKPSSEVYSPVILGMGNIHLKNKIFLREKRNFSKFT